MARPYGWLRSRNLIPSRYEAWEDGERTKDIPIEKVIGGPAFRSSHSDHLLQTAHALLKQEEEPSPRVERMGIDRAFGILDPPQPQSVEARLAGRRQTVKNLRN